LVEHKIIPGLSTIYTREAGHGDVLPASSAAGIMDFLVSTPAVLTMAIEATRDLLDPLLPEGYITAGKHIELSHERPTLIGETITLVITVFEVKGESIFLDIMGHDSTGVICKGKYERSIVNRDHLIDIAYKRAKSYR
jgi:fluoroacetyl-CoA thioesterase